MEARDEAALPERMTPVIRSGQFKGCE